ncbi:helicase and polymerase-containing protein TEBICHI [Oryza brachyantha]|uniref:helicase and polymerase-containing protein TEBICHI n=1 Tax=Oryza brachyantha TaxID=4533 RepID=UPI00077658EA|nr:helicase and polymerase-containing protein TEBICHI [Oryza brachyantha]XP_040385264.1 helicase and polymerase-containing protein TEBICHI [Oryza brachyantha]XP_040385265.1 helicase and polymerase-containing protein TEBICHI [Oryza brachyantha]XP_040385266.1 helicase and polymerase-containing protein TEBICHI [Oryza brachyantha]
MASGSSRANIDQFFPAKKRRPSSRKDEPPSGSPGGAKGSLEGFLVRSPSAAPPPTSGSPSGGGDAGARRSLSAAMDVDVGHPASAVAKDKGDLELKRIAMEFLSHYCSAIPSVMGDAGNGEADKKQKRSATQSFLVPCSNASAKKQRVAHCGGLEALKDVGHQTLFQEQCGTHYGCSDALEELGEVAKVSSEGFVAWQRCSFTPNTGQKKVGFSTAPGAGETPRSVSTKSLISPGEEFWNAAIEFADGISAQADKGLRRPECDVDDKSSCAVALCSKILPRSGQVDIDYEKTVGSNETKYMDESSSKEGSVAANSHHVNSSPLPVKHLDFFHEDEIQVPGLKTKQKGGTVDVNHKGQLKNSSFQRVDNLMHSVDDMNKNTSDMRIDSSATTHNGRLFKLTTAGTNHPTRVGASGFSPTKRDLNQLIHSADKMLTACSNHDKPNKDCTNKFASQETEANTPTSSVLQKDHSKLSSWLPPELCAIYMKKGISQLYPWQVECLLVEGVVEKRNLVYCASTSAGKSFVAEVLMLRRILFSGKMAILVLPYVSICAEKAEHLEQLLEPLGRHVRGFYGNQGGGSLPKDTSVAVCTIEKANSLVNKLLEDGRLSELGIIVIDELHMVGDQHRGYLLELMLTKLRYAAGEGNSESSSAETSGSSSGKMDATHGLQIIGMSATMPNVAAVADWLQAALYQTEFRPVPLEEFIKVGNQVFDKDMNVVRVLPKVADLGGKDPDHIVELCNEVVLQGHSVLLFCSSRKGCESTARHIAKFLKSTSIGSSDVDSEFADATCAIEALKRSPSGLDPVLEETLPFGVAYHHAGLTVEEREIVETCYRKGLVRVLTATSTLAAGVNLPARRVIFRQPRIGRDFIDGTRYRQMSGRAGRTGIDTKGESILLCKPEEVKRITCILRSNCPPLESCLSEDKNGMTHAIMEVVAGGIVQTASDINRYVRCTLLNSTKPFEDVVKSAQDSLRWLCHKRFLEWNNESKIYSTTPLGRAAFGSSLNPEESLVVLDDLSRAREGFVLASDLHLVYLVTPINVDVEPDWELYYERFMQLTSLEQSVGNRVGVIEPFLMHMAHGAAMPVRGKRQLTGIRNRSPTRGSGGNALINAQTLRVSKRFYVALMLSRLAQEIPVTDVCEAFKVARGMIQALQENAGRFASMVSVFCQRLGWHDLEGLVAKFQNRVCFGVRAEIAELTSIPFVKGSRARALYKSGLRTPVAIAEASIPEIAKALFESSTWSGQDDSGLRRMQLGIAKKIKNGARKIVLEEAEAARVAAFSAFKSLGVQVPQFTTPLLSTIDEPPTRDNMVSHGRGQAKCHDPTLGMHGSGDRNICFSYGAQRASAESALGNDMHPGSSKQITESAGIANNVNISVQEASPLSTGTIDKLSSRNVADKGPVNAYNFPGGFDSFLDQWSTVSEFSFDLHYVKKSIKSSSIFFDILGLAVCWENSPVYYCNFPKDLMIAGSNDSIEMWEELTRRWNRIIEIMRRNNVKKMTWNLKVEIQALKYPCVSCQRLARLHLDYKMLKNVEVLDNLYVFLPPISVHSGLDICLVAWVLWPDEESKTVPNLEKLVKRRLHHEAAAAATRDGRWRNQMHKAAHNGCCRRAAQTRALGSVLRKLLVSHNLNGLLETIEGPLVNVLADMELWGIGADMDACLHARHIIIKKLKELEKEAYKLAGKSFSLNSTADIADILYTHLKLPAPKGCEKGKLHPSTNKQSLDHLRDQHPIISVIKEHRTLAKLLNGTLGSICSRAQLCSKSQRYIIQGNWLQTSTATGRLSMEEPNLQCVEHLLDFTTLKNDYDSTVDHHEINARDFFVPTRENWLLITADYSQIELRLMAHFSKDPTLIELLNKPDGDVFTMITSRWSGKEESLICSKERETTKRFIYGILYGMGANSLAEQLQCSPEDAAQKIQSFKRFFPGVSSWLHEAVASCRQKGYVETLMGRRRFLSKITVGNSKEKAKAQRQAVNSICQGSAADIIKVAMIKVHSVITNGRMMGTTDDFTDEVMQKFSEIRGRCHLILQVHDELVLEVDPCMVAEAGRLLQTVMGNAASLLVPLRTKIKVGKTWGSLEPFHPEP